MNTFQMWFVAIILCGNQIVYASNIDGGIYSELDVTKQISFLCYLDSLEYVEIPYEDSVTSLPSQCIRNTNDTVVFYFPGWTNSPSKHDERVDGITREFLKRGGILPIVVNYETLQVGPDVSTLTIRTLVPALVQYAKSRMYVDVIASKVADVFIQLYNNNQLPIENVRLIGLSIGAQIEGRVGRNFAEFTNRKLPRITALDPAGPLFLLPGRHLTKNDAQFVDVIHTTPGIIGFPFAVGHVDFYVNFPIPLQPGCPPLTTILTGNLSTIFCSHERSGIYYAQSINNANQFPVCNSLLPCKILPFLFGNLYMGYDVSTKAFGIKAVAVPELDS